MLKTFANGTKLPTSKGLLHHGLDEKDFDFGPIRTSTNYAIDLPTSRSLEESHGIRRIVWLCCDILSRAAVLQSQGGDVATDKSIIDLVCDCVDDDRFIVILTPLLWNAKRKNIRITGSIIDRILQRIEKPLMSYRHSRSTDLCLASVNLLTSTIHVWLASNTSSSELSGKIRTLVRWLIGSLKTGDWKTRDSVVRFFDRYLILDPRQEFFLHPDEDEEVDLDSLPASLLPSILQDDDTRVRVTAAKACARLFSSTYMQTNEEDRDAMTIYGEVRQMLCIDLTQ